MVRLFRRGKKSEREPKNVNKFLANESKLKEMEIVKRELEGPKPGQILLKRPSEKLNDIRKNTYDVMHRIAYFNPKVEEKTEFLEAQGKRVNFGRQLKSIEKKNQELNRMVGKSKKEK